MRTGQQRVLKIFRQVPDVVEGSTTFDRFLREYDLVAHLEHPNIARIYDLGVADDHCLHRDGVFSRRRPALADARAACRCARGARYLRQLAAALGALHAIGVLHRDVKPGNVLLREDGTVAFIDFGLARQLGLESDITGNGAIFGTPHYMSPEQGHGLPLDERSDLYSLGVVLYEMLTGAEALRRGVAARGHLHARATRRYRACRRRPQHLQPLLDALLAKQAADRPASAEEIVARDRRAAGARGGLMADLGGMLARADRGARGSTSPSSARLTC